MSKVKSAPKKKWLSLQLDRRPPPDEKPRTARKDAAREKQRTHKDERRVVHRALGSLDPHPGEDDAVAAELTTKVKSRLQQLKAPKKKKKAAVPLGKAIAIKRTRRKGGTS